MNKIIIIIIIIIITDLYSAFRSEDTEALTTKVINRFHFSILTRDIDIAYLSVRYVPVLYENDLNYCNTFFTVR